MATAFFKDYFTVIRRMIFGYLAYVTLSTVKDLTLVCFIEMVQEPTISHEMESVTLKTDREYDSGQTEGVRISYRKSEFEDYKSSTKNAEPDLEDADVNKDAEITQNCKQIHEDEDIDDSEDEKDEEVNDSEHDEEDKIFIIQDYKNEKDIYDTFDDTKEDEDVSDKKEKDEEEPLMEPEKIVIFYTLEDDQIRREIRKMCRDYKEMADMFNNIETLIDQETKDFPKSTLSSQAKQLLKTLLLYSTDYNIQVNYRKTMVILQKIFKDLQTSGRSIDTIQMILRSILKKAGMHSGLFSALR
ncbi:uncharacterized protein LOC106077817 isoform X4 [Biomphalaria glabrata]|uniref:Uncharacterized protein LOC106077817 isoform X4 n=1 Tax=Biomphalaria glabrata TaxID=6526 RepID=A0A9W2YR76_BIOGL|nr:uncharacterized protein LOC106077817 isoform X4 [Biomphalaria glabrata]